MVVALIKEKNMKVRREKNYTQLKHEEKVFGSTISHSHPHNHEHHHHTHGHDELDSHHHEHEHTIKIWGDERGYTIIGGEDEGLVE